MPCYKRSVSVARLKSDFLKNTKRILFYDPYRTCGSVKKNATILINSVLCFDKKVPRLWFVSGFVQQVCNTDLCSKYAIRYCSAFCQTRRNSAKHAEFPREKGPQYRIAVLYKTDGTLSGSVEHTERLAWRTVRHANQCSDGTFVAFFDALRVYMTTEDDDTHSS